MESQLDKLMSEFAPSLMGDSMYLLKRRLKRRARCRRILNVRSEIVAVIDTRENMIGLARHDVEHAYTHAVGRSAVAGISVNALHRENPPSAH